jgi:transposase-like protein
MNGLPTTFAPGCPSSRTVAPYSPSPAHASAKTQSGDHQGHPPRFIRDTNTIEALNRQIRKIIKTRGSFPNEDAARKLLYLAITRAQTKWRHTYNWTSALAALRIHFGDRLPDTAI